MTATTGETLGFSHVRHAFGRRMVVDDVSFAVGAGRVTCLVGPSGCGKSTTLRLAAGLEPLQQGEIRVQGRVVSGGGRQLPPEARGVGLVFQDFALFPHLSVIDNVGFGLTSLGSAERRDRAMATLGAVGMEGYASAFPHMLSGGQQQRIALARALAPRPPVMLLDEPFSGLDSRLRNQVRDDTLHLLKASHSATLLVTHDPEEAMFMADTIAVMRDGRIEQLGAPADIWCRPATAYVATFFGEVNRLEARAAGGQVATPVGGFLAPPTVGDGAVEVLIRPEGVRIASASGDCDNGPRARVTAARLLGRSSLIHLQVDGPSPLHMHARLPGIVLPEEGAEVTLTVDPAQVFVFPLGQAVAANAAPSMP